MLVFGKVSESTGTDTWVLMATSEAAKKICIYRGRLKERKQRASAFSFSGLREMLNLSVLPKADNFLRELYWVRADVELHLAIDYM